MSLSRFLESFLGPPTAHRAVYLALNHNLAPDPNHPSTRLSAALHLLFFCIALFAPSVLLAQNYGTNGAEYAIAGNLPGDQVHPHVALGSTGGYLVWEDNNIDGDG